MRLNSQKNTYVELDDSEAWRDVFDRQMAPKQ